MGESPINQHSPLTNQQSLLSYGYGEANLLHQAHLNHLQERQKFSGHSRPGGHRDRYQQAAAVAGISREARRRRPVPGFRQHPQPGVQGAAAAEIEKGSDRDDAREPESHPASDHDQGVESDLRLRQG